MSDDEKKLLASLKNLRIVPDNKAHTDCAYCICGPRAVVPGCLQGNCALCGVKVYFVREKPGMKMICLPCAGKLFKNDPNPETYMTESDAADVMKFLLRDKLN